VPGEHQLTRSGSEHSREKPVEIVQKAADDQRQESFAAEAQEPDQHAERKAQGHHQEAVYEDAWVENESVKDSVEDKAHLLHKAFQCQPEVMRTQGLVESVADEAAGECEWCRK
jgi:hypothetical protein